MGRATSRKPKSLGPQEAPAGDTASSGLGGPATTFATDNASTEDVVITGALSKNASGDPQPSNNESSTESEGEKADLRELARMRKQRKQAELRAQVMEEKRLLAEAQARVEAAEAALETDSRAPQGQKRPRAHTDTPLPIRPPPKPAMDALYEGKNMKEYDTFKLRLRNHFRKYHTYFDDDDQKIVEAVGCLNDNILLRWSQHADGLEATPTWAKFENFFLC